MLSESRRKLTRSATPNQRTPRAASAAPAGLFKRPTHAVEELHQVAATRTERRLFAQVDFRREMRPIAFVDPGAFLVTYSVKLPTRRLLDNLAELRTRRTGQYLESARNGSGFTLRAEEQRGILLRFAFHRFANCDQEDGSLAGRMRRKEVDHVIVKEGQPGRT